MSNNYQLLPPPAAIVPPTSNPSVQSSAHSQQAALLAASQLLASSGVYPQELLASGLLPYPHYYRSLPGAPFYMDPHLMHDLTTAANNEQLKNLRSNRHLSHVSGHSPPETSTYPTQSSKRLSHEGLGKKRKDRIDVYSIEIFIFRTCEVSIGRLSDIHMAHTQYE